MIVLKTMLFSSLALGVGLSTSAQQPVPSQSHEPGLPGGTSILQKACGIAQEDGVLWGLGPDYKAAFTRGGMEYTPALGMAAPRNQPLRITLQSITRGGVVLYEANPGVAPAAMRDGESIVYRRARDILEKFHVRPDGVELRYVFGNRPSGSGDLVVRARIDSELALRPDHERGARFVLDGIGGVTIGGVTGIDALGATTPGSLRCDGTSLEMTLPAEFVDRAAYPLVLDPLVGTQFLLGSTTWTETAPAVAYDLNSAVYLVVWRRAFSGTDSDIRAQRVSRTGNPVGSVMGLTIIPGQQEIAPTVAGVRLRGRFLVTWQQASSPFGPWDLACRAVDAGTGALSAIVPVHSAPDDDTDPDAAGENSTGDNVLLVWRREFGGILGTTISLAGTDPVVQTLRTITSRISAIEPAISTSGPSAHYYAVVWKQRLPESIRARAVTRDMVLQGTELTVTSFTGTGLELQHPAVDGSGDYLVAWNSATSSTRTVWCRKIQWNGTTLVNASSPRSFTGPNSTGLRPAVGWLGGKYVLLWMENGVIRGAELDPDCRVCGQPVQLAGLRTTPGFLLTPDIGTVRAGGEFAGDDALIVFGEADTSPPFTSDVLAQRIEAFTGGARRNLFGGCGNGGTAGASTAAIGNSGFLLTLAGAAPSATFMAAGVSFTGTSNGCGLCSVLNTPYWFLVFPSRPGQASYPLGIPCNPTFVGLPVHSQWAVFASGASPCPLAPAGAQVSFSNRFVSVVDY